MSHHIALNLAVSLHEATIANKSTSIEISRQDSEIDDIFYEDLRGLFLDEVTDFPLLYDAGKQNGVKKVFDLLKSDTELPLSAKDLFRIDGLRPHVAYNSHVRYTLPTNLPGVGVDYAFNGGDARSEPTIRVLTSPLQPDRLYI